MKYKTKYQENIMNYIEDHKDQSFCAADVYAYMIRNEIQINLATVYRNLDKLTADHTLMKYKAADSDSFLYQYAGVNGDCQEHLHLQCSSCGKIYHLDGDFMKKMAEYLTQTHMFKLDCAASSIRGLCEECQGCQGNKI